MPLFINFCRRYSNSYNPSSLIQRAISDRFMDLLYGTESVYAAMQMKRRKVIGPLFVLEGKLPSESDSIGKGKSTVFKNILEIAQRDQIQIIRTSKHDLNLLAENRPHNGVVLKASPLRDLLEEEASDDAPLIRDQGGKIWVAVDQVMDPQNLGTIIRNSFYFGAEQVIICRKNSAPLSAVVSKSSVGAMEYMNLRFCRSMPRFLSNCLQTGEYDVLGLSLAEKSVDCRTFSPEKPVILVVGNEGFGLRKMVEDSCTKLLKIPSQSQSQNKNLDSLNVATALGIVLYQISKTSIS